MSNLIDGIISQVSQQAIGSLTETLGEDKSKIESATKIAIPTIMQAFVSKASDSDIADKLISDENEQANILDNVSEFVKSKDSEKMGTGILNNILGDKLNSVVSSISGESGLGQNTTTTLLAKLAPIVMSFLGKTKQESGLDIASLATIVTSATGSSGISGAIGSILGSTGTDSNLKENLINKGGSILKNLF